MCNKHSICFSTTSCMKFGAQLASPKRLRSCKWFEALIDWLIESYFLHLSLVPLNKTLCTSPSTVFIFSSLFLLSVGHFSDQPPERCPEGPGWDELRYPVSVWVQHGPHQSCRRLAHWPGGTAILETQYRDHCECEELKPRHQNDTEQFR